MQPQLDGTGTTLTAACRICVVCDHASLRELMGDAELERLWAEVPDALVELRLDAYSDLTPSALSGVLKAFGPARCIVTFRSQQEGGLAQPPPTDATRCRYYALALQASVYAVDTELATLQRHRPLGALWQSTALSRRVVSVHFKHGQQQPTAAALMARRDAAEAWGADVVKLVVAPETMVGCGPLLDLLETRRPAGRPLIGLAMGRVGQWSRVLAPRWPQPAPWTYARLQSRPPNATGQWCWQTLTRLFRLAQMGPQTPVYGLVGAPVEQSESPQLHNRWLARRDLPGVYLPFHVEADSVAFFVQSMAVRLGIVGLSVTHPHKIAVLQTCYSMSDVARQIGAVNTLMRPRARCVGGAAVTLSWWGDNTDAAAALRCLRAAYGRPLAGCRVFLLGAGGVAHAVAHAVRHAGGHVLICARRPAAAASLARAVQGSVVHMAAVQQRTVSFDIVVNCTPVGMAPNPHNEVPMQVALLPAGCLVFDTIYRPYLTVFLQQAAAAKHPTIGGLKMFTDQAAAQFTHFTGQSIPAESF